MGSISSKHKAGEASTSSSSAGRRRLFQLSCLRLDDGDDDRQVADYQSEENCCNGSSGNQIILDSDHVKDECYGKANKSDEIVCKGSSSEIDERGQSKFSGMNSRSGSSSRALSPSDRFLSRCSFFPGNSSFRLSKAPITGSSRTNPASARSFSASNEEDNPNLGKSPLRDSVSRSKPSRGRDFLPSCLINRCTSPQYEDHALGCLDSNSAASGFSCNSGEDQIVSNVNVLRDGNNHREQCNVNLQTSANFINFENMDLRHTERHIGGREPVERNVRFSRTLSVGRLRDRVLRRSSFPDITFSPLQQDRELGDTVEGVGAGVVASNASNLVSSNSIYHSSGMSGSSYSGPDYEVETSRARESRYRDLLEHSSNFLERRRRIRSQVRALQRLGSRFENLSGHERSCIISGQHRTGHCTCRIASRDSSPNDDTNSRQSISRIVMLAEALFEVLDEIHQQSVVLSSRPSVSSIGSIPAPSDVVDSLPVKLYRKSQKYLIEEPAQCYICLVEYEEGDTVRTLPCHHDFHRACVDKWLKEIHRVCPLCRGDICMLESMPLEN